MASRKKRSAFRKTYCTASVAWRMRLAANSIASILSPMLNTASS